MEWQAEGSEHQQQVAFAADVAAASGLLSAPSYCIQAIHPLGDTTYTRVEIFNSSITPFILASLIVIHPRWKLPTFEHMRILEDI